MHVPYRGGAPALNDLLGDHVDLYVSSLPQVLEIVRTGKAKGLAVTSSSRSQSLPDVPTLAEAGLSGVDVGSWWGIVAPAGTPQPVIAALNTEINKLLTSEDMRRFLQGEGAEAKAMTPDQFGDLIRSETERWIKVARQSGISID
jgi:tripartite-type tricarboxylate transporter receptor subunit TctC